MIDNNIFTSNFFATLISLYIFLLLFMPQYDMFWIIGLFIVNIFYLFLNRKKALKLNISITLFFVFFVVSFLGLYRNKNINYETRRYILFLGTNILVLFNLSLMKNWVNKIISSLVLVCIFYVVGAFLQILTPNLLNIINSIHLVSTHYTQYNIFREQNILVGFVQNPAIFGFMLHVLLNYLFIKSYLGNGINKILERITFAVLFLLLILTGKRIFLLSSIIIIGYLIFQLSKNKFKAIFPLILFILLFIILINTTEMGQILLQRTLQANNIEEATTGRSLVFDIMWQGFKESPIFGQGTYTTKNVINLNNGHNIYLQILRENGIIGGILFFLILGINLIKAHLMINKSNPYIKEVAFSFSLQILFIIWGMTGNPLYDNYPLMVYITGVAITWYFALKIKKKQKIGIFYEKNNKKFGVKL